MNLKFEAPFCVVGAGKTGRALVDLLLCLGHSKESISFFDDKAVEERIEGILVFSSPEKMETSIQPKTLLVSPGYPLASKWIQDLEGRGVLVSSELELVSSLLKDEKVLAVTGSLGKSTVVSMLGQAILELDSGAFVGGNLGLPLASYMKQVLLKERPRATYIVLELSSYQLERCRNFKCVGAIISYFSANHLDRYKDIEHYYETKWQLVKHCEGPVILNLSSNDLKSFAQKKSETVKFVNSQKGPLGAEDFRRCLVMGEHQRDNLSLVASLIQELKLPFGKIWPRVEKFQGLEHRLEYVGSYSGLKFVNDSKATAMESVLSAVKSCLESVPKESSLCLMLGGKDKNLPWHELKTLSENARIVLLAFGASRELIEKGIGQKLPKYASLHEALAAIPQFAKKGDWILLSPGGTSLDEFKNFEDRGREFKKWIQELYGERDD